MKKGFEYLLIIFAVFIICLNSISAAVPTFTTIPANSSIFYSNGSLNVMFNATNTSAFGSYYLNDTRFTITQYGITTNNQTANLTNATPMTNLAVGTYLINVTINSSANEINSTIYKIQINKSNYFDCGVYFNASTPLTYPVYPLIYTNCSSAYTIYNNGTSISNNTAISSGAGYYNITVQRTDTTNYTNTVMSQFFTINKAAPIVYAYVNNSRANLTLESARSIWLNATFNNGSLGGGSLGLLVDEGSQNSSTTLTSLSVYYTTFNTLGFHNVTASFTGNQNYTAGSETFNVTVRDTTAPTYSLNSSSTTEVGKTTTFAIYVNDNTALHPNKQYNFSTNNTGVWVNDTANFTTTPQWVNVSKTLNSTVGKYIGYRWFFNDTSGNTASTPIYTLTTTADATAPTYSDEDLSTLLAGKICDFSINITDDLALETNGQYIFSTDNSGIWVNETAVNFTAISEIVTVSKKLTSTVGEEVSYRWFFSDNAGNTASSPIYTITTNGGFNGGSSGGSAGIKSTPTVYSTDEQFSGSGEQYTLKTYDKVNFAVASASHTLTVKAVGAMVVKVEIASTPIAATLQKGVLYGFDLTGDSVNDLNVRYDGLSGAKAMIFMQEIKKTTTPAVQEEVTTPTETTTEPTNSVPGETINEGNEKGLLDSSLAKIILIVLVIVLAIIIIASVSNKKQKKKRYLLYGY